MDKTRSLASRYLSYVLIWAFFFACSDGNASGQCISSNLVNAFEDAEAVFLGKVSRIDSWTDAREKYKTHLTVHLDVEKSWKGNVKDFSPLQLMGHYRFTDYREFKEGKSYLIYAYRQTGHTSLRKIGVSKCSRTKPASSALIEMEYLDALAARRDINELNNTLKNKLQVEDSNIRAEALALMREMIGSADKSEIVYDAMLRALSDSEEAVKNMAVSGLLTSDLRGTLRGNEEIIEALLPLLASTDPHLRANTASAMATVGKKNSLVFREVLNASERELKFDKAFNPESLRIMVQSAMRLAHTHEQMDNALKVMLASLDKLDAYEQTHIIQHLGSMGIQDETAAAKLIQLLKTSNGHHNRDYIISALGKMVAREAVDEIGLHVEDKDCGTSSALAEALNKIDTKRSQELIRQRVMPFLISNFGSCPDEYLETFEVLKEKAITALPVLYKYKDQPNVGDYWRSKCEEAITLLEKYTASLGGR